MESSTKSRTLGPREAEIVAWLETERPADVTLDQAAEAFNWPRKRIREVMAQLARKGWLIRTQKGHYEPLLGESGGIALPNPWAALAGWKVDHYVAFASAAYELGLTPDRPGDVQVCVRPGTSRPRLWAEFPLLLIPERSFSLDGTERRELHGFPIRIATPEKVLLDGGAIPSRVGGAIGLARILDRAEDRIDWTEFKTLAEKSKGGRRAARRLAALLELLGREIPEQLAVLAKAKKGSRIYLDSSSIHGRRGQLLDPWQVIVNVATEALSEEISR